MIYQVLIQPVARKMLAEISDRRIQQMIRERIDALKDEPEKQGKPLSGDFVGHRSVRAVGQRYRIVYRVESRRVVVEIVALGLRNEGDRRDIYEVARRLLKLKLVR